MPRVTDSRSKKVDHSIKGRQKQLCVAYPIDHVTRLKALVDAGQKPMAQYFHEALGDLLDKYEAKKKRPRTIGGDTGEYIGEALSEIELIAAADAIDAAIAKASPGRIKEALERVRARLAMAYKWKKAAEAE